MSGGKVLDRIKIVLRGDHGTYHNLYIDVFDNSLSRKWLTALNHLLANNYHLEKNYCFFGFHNGPRNLEYLCEQINRSIDYINRSHIGYHIDCDAYTVDNVIQPDLDVNHARLQEGIPRIPRQALTDPQPFHAEQGPQAGHQGRPGPQG